MRTLLCLCSFDKKVNTIYFQQVKIKSVKQFFGPVVTSVPEPIVEGDVTVTPPLSARDDDGEEIPIISFRLKGT